MATRWEIVILGGGFAGLSCAQRLERLLPREVAERILLVNSENYFTFYALLPDVVGASIEPGHVIHPVRQLLKRIQVQRAEVKAIDLTARRVEFEPRDGLAQVAVEAEHLILAMGTGADMHAVPGMMEHALFLRTIADALELRGHLVRRLEEANLHPDQVERQKLLQFLVVGGGFSGVEVAGQMLDFLHEALRYYPDLRETKPQITLVHSQSHLLPELDQVLGEQARLSLEKRGLRVVLNRRVKSVSGEAVRLDDDTCIATANCICTIGNAPHPVLQTLEVERHRGRILTDECLRLKGYANVWAVGDCAASPDGAGGFTAPTGQFATRLGKHVAKNLVAARSGKTMKPFNYQSVGQLASIGHHNGVCKLKGVRLSGFLAWWLARTVHLLLLPGIRSKLRVVIDWTLELFFSRDLTYLDLRKTETIGRVHLEPGEELFHQGERSHAFYVLEEGSVRLSRCDAQGCNLFEEVLTAGSHFGEGSLLRDEVRSTTAVAITPSTLLVIGPRDFGTLIAHSTVLREALQETSFRFRPEEELLKSNWPSEFFQIKVCEVMTTPVETIPVESTLAEAFQFHAERRRGSLPLVDREGKISGLLTRTDLYRAVLESRDMQSPAANLAAAHVVTLRGGQTLREVLGTFRRKRLKHAPVVDDAGKPIGMLSYVDMVLAGLKMRQHQSPTTVTGAAPLHAESSGKNA